MSDRWRKFLLGRVHSLTEIALLFAGAGTVAGYFGAYYWALDLASHFRVQYAVLLPLCAVIFTVLKRWKLAILAVTLTVPNLISLAPFFPRSTEPIAAGVQRVKVISLNVHTASTEYAKVRSYLESRDPDVVFLMEVDEIWEGQLDPFVKRYPHTLVHPRSDNFGVVFATRLPVEKLEVLKLGDAEPPSVLAVVREGTERFGIIGTHPVPPAGPAEAMQRDEQLAGIAGTIASMPMPLLLIGDLNATPFSASFRSMVERARLRDPARGGGLLFSWKSPLWGLRLPIDHALATEGLLLGDRKLGPDVASDHFPLEISVIVPDR